MAERLTVRLPDDLNEALVEAASRRGRTRSEIFRLALVQFLGVRKEDAMTPADRVRSLLGVLDGGGSDPPPGRRQAPPLQ